MLRTGNVVSLAYMAVELHLAHSNLEDMAFSVAVHSMIACDEAKNLEQLSARLGILSHVPARVIADKNYHANLLGQAFELLKALIPFEAEVRAIAARKPELAKVAAI